MDDHEGVEISLNKIGICFFMANQAEDSLRFHEKHFEFTSKKQYDNDNSKMISLYNQAMAVRKIQIELSNQFLNQQEGLISSST